MRQVTRELDTLEYSVSILGGYDDENSTSEEITEMLITVMQGLKARFILQLACTGLVNKVMKNIRYQISQAALQRGYTQQYI